MFHSALTRRRAFTTTITTMALTAALIAGASTLSAQTTDKTALAGSWLGTVTFPPESGRPPLKYVGSFHEDGTMVSSDQGGVTMAPLPTVFSSFYGVWTHLEQRTFAYTGLELISDLSGNLVGYLKARGVYTVSQSGNEYSGATHAEVLDADGNVLFSVDVTNTAQRIQVERPE